MVLTNFPTGLTMPEKFRVLSQNFDCRTRPTFAQTNELPVAR